MFELGMVTIPAPLMTPAKVSLTPLILKVVPLERLRVPEYVEPEPVELKGPPEGMEILPALTLMLVDTTVFPYRFNAPAPALVMFGAVRPTELPP